MMQNVNLLNQSKIQVEILNSKTIQHQEKKILQQVCKKIQMEESLLKNGQPLKDKQLAIVHFHNQMQVLRLFQLVHLIWDKNNSLVFQLNDKVFEMDIAVIKLLIMILALVMKKREMILRRIIKVQKILRDMCRHMSQSS